MRVAITAALAAAAALTAASMLGVASAEAPTTPTQLRTVSVQGVANETIDQHADAATATSVYHQGLLDAVADGAGKAQLLAGKVGAGLGAAQSVVEGSGYIRCAGGGGPGEAEYEGAQPDFGSGQVVVANGPVAGAAPLAGVPQRKSPGRRGSSRRRRPAARKASVGTCTLSTQVSLVYVLG